MKIEKVTQLVTKARDDDGDSLRSPQYSDDALALNFADKHAGDRKYVAAWSRWLTWDGKRWVPDDTYRIFDDARAVCRTAATSCNDAKMAKGVASATTVAAVERLSRSDRRLAARPSQFDADAWVLNTPDGLVDLRTGDVREATRDDFVSKMTAVGPGRACPKWLEFIRQFTDGDHAVERFLARSAGYTLTGSTREHAFFFLSGTGGNGKSVFINTIASVLGDYATPAPIEMFTLTKFQTHTTDIAGLQGARMVTASETEAGRTLAEAKVKLLTGGDAISARRMRADNVQFVPQFKLWMMGNHKPRITTSDEAIRRRIHLIPCTVNIPPWQRDPRLPEKLAGEWPGIFSWILDGCAEWLDQGLSPPTSIRQATDDYLSSEDAILSWLGSEIEVDPNAKAITADLFASWSAWATSANEEVGPQKEFVKALRNKNLILDHTREGNRWLGIRLKGKIQ